MYQSFSPSKCWNPCDRVRTHSPQNYHKTGKRHRGYHWEQFSEEKGLFDWKTSHLVKIVTYALTIDGVGVGVVLSKEYLPPQIGCVSCFTGFNILADLSDHPFGLLSVSLLNRLDMAAAAAAVYREVYMYTIARIEVAGLLGSLSGLCGTKMATQDSMSRFKNSACHNGYKQIPHNFLVWKTCALFKTNSVVQRKHPDSEPLYDFLNEALLIISTHRVDF
ncbi:hypothetical protein IW262DRAFT_1483136 [Armillaria fumosa]|nr:hypothetical protein IW262DRAFT_1483136 [Armillaria fumosa]